MLLLKYNLVSEIQIIIMTDDQKMLISRIPGSETFLAPMVETHGEGSWCGWSS